MCGYVCEYLCHSVDVVDDYGVHSSNEPLSVNYVDGISITYGILYLLTYGPMLLAIKRIHSNHLNPIVHAIHHQVPVLHHMLATATTVSLDHQPVLPMQHTYGTPVMIPCGMVCSVEEMRDLVVTTLDCPGLTRTHPHPPLQLSTYISVWMRSETVWMLE